MAGDPGSQVEIEISSAVVLKGDLAKPAASYKGFVVFAHGSGSSRLSPRNRFVANLLQEAGFGTLLFDLLTEKEDENYETRFDIDILSERLERVTKWILDNRQLGSLKLGYFGASTGAAAALIASAKLGHDTVKAVVSRGGRPDMAGDFLPRVQVPTLLIVGGRDEEVLELNQSALRDLGSQEKQLVVVPRATHLFEEPGTLDIVAKHAIDWFRKYL